MRFTSGATLWYGHRNVIDVKVNSMTGAAAGAVIGAGGEMVARMYSVTELAQELGVTPRTLRFYEDKGLIKPQRVGGNRVYLPRDRGRLILILRGKRLGFSLREISEYLDLYDADPTHRTQIDRLLHLVQDRIQLLERQREALEETLDELREIEQLALDAIGKPDASTSSDLACGREEHSQSAGEHDPTEDRNKGAVAHPVRLNDEA